MASTIIEKRRDKMVMFRLTKDEFVEIRRRSKDDDARTLSDWVRARLLAPTDLGSRVERLEQAILGGAK